MSLSTEPNLFRVDPTDCLEEIDQYCGNCYKRCSEYEIELNECDGCPTIYYCGSDCQGENYPDHKEYCSTFRQLYDTMKKEEKQLRRTGYFAPGNIGHFWDLVDPRDYCRARYAFAQHILGAAYNNDGRRGFEEALSHFLELLRLCHSDGVGVRYEVPFVLLYLNRDEAAYNFVKSWQMRSEDDSYDWGDVPENTKEGDWLFMKDQDIYEDLLQIVDPNHINLHWLTALTLIKMRIVCKYNLWKEKMESLQQCTAKWSNDLIQSTIQQYLMGHHMTNQQCVDELIAKQTDLVNKYLTQMIKDNEVFVKAILNPGPLKSQLYPYGFSKGSKAEALIVLYKCNVLFYRTNGTSFIKERVGKHPTYDPVISDEFYTCY